MNYLLKEFIENHSEDIDTYNFEKVYQAMPLNITRKFTLLLYKLGIDPLLYMSEVPENFLIDSTSIKSITIPNNIKKIGSYAFSDCTNLKNVTIGNSVKRIEDGAFYNCSGLTSITIPDSVTSIRSSAFQGCTGLTNVTIGNSVTGIGSDAFYGCTSLTNITIPTNSVKFIGRYVFGGCTSLTEITFGGTKQQWKNMSEESFSWNSASSIKKIICIDGEVVL